MSLSAATNLLVISNMKLQHINPELQKKIYHMTDGLRVIIVVQLDTKKEKTADGSTLICLISMVLQTRVKTQTTKS